MGIQSNDLHDGMIGDADRTSAIVYGGKCWEDYPERVPTHLLENQVEGGVPSQRMRWTLPVSKTWRQSCSKTGLIKHAGPRNNTRVEFEDLTPRSCPEAATGSYQKCHKPSPILTERWVGRL